MVDHTILGTAMANDEVPIEIRKANLSVNVNFASHFWSLFHDIPAFYSALLSRLNEFGLTAQSIKNDAGDGSIGGFNVNFWLLNFQALVRIRLERFELQCNDLNDADVTQVAQVFVKVLAALKETRDNFAIANYTLDLGLHGQLKGQQGKDFVSRFVGHVPDLGPVLGAGVVFYFGARGAAATRNLTLDLSAVVPTGLFIRFVSVYDGEMNPEAIHGAFRDDLDGAVRAVGLTPAS